jgi:hypothetical protein
MPKTSLSLYILYTLSTFHIYVCGFVQLLVGPFAVVIRLLFLPPVCEPRITDSTGIIGAQGADTVLVEQSTTVVGHDTYPPP